MDAINQGEVLSSTYTCSYCGEMNSTFVDPSQGRIQKYIEDCQVCCRPNELNISYDAYNEAFMIRAKKTQ